MSKEVLEQLLAQGPRPFDSSQDVDLLDYIEAFIADRLKIPSLGGLVYAPSVDDVDLSGPVWPVQATGGAASLAVVDGQLQLSGVGQFALSRYIAPLPAGYGVSVTLEFKVDAGAADAWALRLGAVRGTTEEPGNLYGYPVTIGRGYFHDQSLHPPKYTGGPADDLTPVGDSNHFDLWAVQGNYQMANVIQGGLQNPAIGVLTRNMHLGRWYRLEIRSQTNKPFGMYGDYGSVTLYDAVTGETLFENSSLYALPIPRLGLFLGKPHSYAVAAAGFTEAAPVVTVRRWIDRRIQL